MHHTNVTTPSRSAVLTAAFLAPLALPGAAGAAWVPASLPYDASGAVGASASTPWDARAAATAVERSALQEAPDTLQVRREYAEEAERLARLPAVRRALEHVRQHHPRTVEDQVALTEIPAPPFGEEERGRAFAGLLREAGADSVYTDAEGNVIGIRFGTHRRGVDAVDARWAGARASDRGPAADGDGAGTQDSPRTPDGERGAVVLSGHLDTVFPEGTDVTVRQRGDTLFAPGISDDGRGLAAVLGVLRALHAAGIRTRADLWFVGTVGEEGLGDLRGAKHLFREGGPRIDAFVSIDGSDADRIVNRALGSRRYRVTYRGPGGHSWGAFGTANPAHALGRAIHRFDGEADAFTAAGPRTSYNVGRVGGGTSVNSIPFEAWTEVDMRSVDQPRLLALDSLFRAAVERALEEQNAVRRRGPPLEAEVELVGDRPSGEVDPVTPLLQRAGAAARLLGFQPVLERSSTDANIPISLGIPAVTIGGGGEGGGAHSPGEWWRDPGDAYRGVQRALLLVLAQAGLTP